VRVEPGEVARARERGESRDRSGRQERERVQEPAQVREQVQVLGQARRERVQVEPSPLRETEAEKRACAERT
jgi:hypothetical protein